MGKSISLFSGYSQKENRTTNYCLLVLKLFYEEDPRFLAEVLREILGENVAEHIGVKFLQQERKALSIPDGHIFQRPFNIFIETKNSDWFYDEQLENHLSGFDAESPGLKVLIALGNFESDDDTRFENIKAICRDKYGDNIKFVAITFDEFISKLHLDHLPKSLVDTVEELKAYLNEADLLASWIDWIDVIACGELPGDVLEDKVFMCPATGGTYSHGRCAYFGMYQEKRVEYVADILALVEVESENSATTRWRNTDTDKPFFEERAKQAVKNRRPGEFPTLVMILGELYKTDILKDTPYGLRNKQYFNISSFKAKNAQELAERLKGKTWSELQKLTNLD